MAPIPGFRRKPVTVQLELGVGDLGDREHGTCGLAPHGARVFRVGPPAKEAQVLPRKGELDWSHEVLLDPAQHELEGFVYETADMLVFPFGGYGGRVNRP